MSCHYFKANSIYCWFIIIWFKNSAMTKNQTKEILSIVYALRILITRQRNIMLR